MMPSSQVQTLNKKYSLQKQLLISFGISQGTYAQFVKTITEYASSRIPTTICVANVHMFIEAYRNKGFAEILKNADIVTPDGKPLTWALKLLNGTNQERVAGMDLFPSLLKSSEETGISVYFLGGSEQMLETLTQKVRIDFPSLHISGHYSPPFRKLSDDEQQSMIEMINNAKPHLIFVALGCPKQETWMYEMKNKLNTVLIGVGGALPVYAGMQKRAPVWMQNTGLEWLYRLFQEPKRLFKRYLVTNTLFVYIIGKALVKKTFGKKPTPKQDDPLLQDSTY